MYLCISVAGGDPLHLLIITVKPFHLFTCYYILHHFTTLARDAFVRTNHRAIAMMSVRLSISPSGMSVHCDHTVHFSADLSLWMDSPMFWEP